MGLPESCRGSWGFLRFSKTSGGSWGFLGIPKGQISYKLVQLFRKKFIIFVDKMFTTFPWKWLKSHHLLNLIHNFPSLPLPCYAQLYFKVCIGLKLNKGSATNGDVELPTDIREATALQLWIQGATRPKNFKTLSLKAKNSQCVYFK